MKFKKLAFQLAILNTFSQAWGATPERYPLSNPPQQRSSHLSSAPHLSIKERESLRFHLENLHNEVDLLIKNQKSHESDFRKLEHDLSALKVFERIPFSPELESLKKELWQSASEQWMEITEVKFSDSPTHPVPLPQVHLTQDPPLILREDQIVKRIPFQIIALGNPSSLVKWMKSLKTEQLRLVEWEHPKIEKNLSELSPGTWKIKGHAFQFLRVRYPRLEPKKPRTYLPAWAKKYPWRFAQQEPILWDLILKTEAKLPKTPPLYQKRGEFKLNEARLSFFLSKT